MNSIQPGSLYLCVHSSQADKLPMTLYESHTPQVTEKQVKQLLGSPGTPSYTGGWGQVSCPLPTPTMLQQAELSQRRGGRTLLPVQTTDSLWESVYSSEKWVNPTQMQFVKTFQIRG